MNAFSVGHEYLHLLCLLVQEAMIQGQKCHGESKLLIFQKSMKLYPVKKVKNSTADRESHVVLVPVTLKIIKAVSRSM